MENHAEEEPELCIGQKLGMIYSLHIDKEAGLRSELRKDKKLKVYEEDEGAGIRIQLILFKNQIINRGK